MDQLKTDKFNLFQEICKNANGEQKKWNLALYNAQKTIIAQNEVLLDENFSIKQKCFVRFINPPNVMPFPNPDQIGFLREIKGIVVRMSQMKLLEIIREFICLKCQSTIKIHADYSLMYKFDIPTECNTNGCYGKYQLKCDDQQQQPLPEYCVNYQELTIQEALSEKNILLTLNITLESDLLDTCQPGDHIILW